MGLLKCGAITAALVAAAALVVPLLLSRPGVPEFLLRGLVQAGGAPESLFDIITVHNPDAWYDVLTKGNLGLAEAYMDGKLDFDPKPLFQLLLNNTRLGTRRAEGGDELKWAMDAAALPTNAAAWLFNQQSKGKSVRVAKQHYDAGNDLYEAMLGPSMSYTCAYWNNVDNLDDAQTAKFELVRRKLQLKPEMRVADLGMGWGTAAAHMHREGGVSVTGVSLSEQQVKWATANLAKPGLSFIWDDYRSLCTNESYRGTFDRVYSIGMLEHVGYKNFPSFFKCIRDLLKEHGLAVVHSIGEPDFVPASDPFLEKYIFPGAVIPALSSLAPALEPYFILEDLHNFGWSYKLTLEAWREKSEVFFKEHPTAYTPQFVRMWRYYLILCEVLFELRINQLWQLVLSPRPATRTGVERQI